MIFQQQLQRSKKMIFIFFNLIEVQLIYNVMLISSVEQSDSVIHIYYIIIYFFFFIFFSIMVYHRTLTIAPCAIQG